MTERALRVVLDTNVLLSLFVFADSRFAPLRGRLEAAHWHALSDQRCLDEYRRVLAYPMFKLDAARQAEAYQAYTRHAALVAPAGGTPIELPRCKDRDDQKFLEVARDGGAELLVTADKALLKLARRDKLRHLFRILTPEAALDELSTTSVQADSQAPHCRP